MGAASTLSVAVSGPLSHRVRWTKLRMGVGSVEATAASATSGGVVEGVAGDKQHGCSV